MKNNNVKIGIIKILSEISGIKSVEITENVSLLKELDFDYDLAASKRIELMLRIEKQYAVKITDKDFDNFKTVGDVIKYVAAKYKKRT